MQPANNPQCKMHFHPQEEFLIYCMIASAFRIQVSVVMCPFRFRSDRMIEMKSDRLEDVLGVLAAIRQCLENLILRIAEIDLRKIILA